MLSTMMQCAGRIRVKDCPFGAPDGVDSQFQLVDRHGHPVTKDVRIASIHQTDWQGRVELSSEPRTNYLPYSAEPSNDGASVVVPTLVNAAAPDGGGEVLEVTFSDNNSRWYPENALQTAVGRRYQSSFWFELDEASGLAYLPININEAATENSVSVRVDPASGAILDIVGDTRAGALSYVSNGWARITFSWVADYASAAHIFRIGYFYKVDSSSAILSPTTVRLYGLMQMSGDVQPGAYIPTSGAPVTVTDYTHGGSGGITTGQVPEDGAELDWSGTARRAA